MLITMIYIENNSKYIEIPLHYGNKFEKFTIKITNNVTNEVFVVANLDNVSTLSYLYRFNVDFPKMNDGEYTYEVYGEGEDKMKLLEVGLLTYGDYKPNIKKQYNDNNKTLKQYGK